MLINPINPEGAGLVRMRPWIVQLGELTRPTSSAPAQSHELARSAVDTRAVVGEITKQSARFDSRSERDGDEEQHSDLEIAIFDALVSLKVMTANYAMHLSAEERRRLFEELNWLLRVEHWDEGDSLPQEGSFKDFLRWTLSDRRVQWSSLGLSDDGFLLAAWVRPGEVELTATFEGGGIVRWFYRLGAGEDAERAGGRYPLNRFSRVVELCLLG